jgi:hypothetical protein
MGKTGRHRSTAVTAIAVAVLASAVVSSASAGSGAPLGYDRALRAIRDFAAQGCTAAHHCRSWGLSGCGRRSPARVSCIVRAEVKSSPCRDTLSASLKHRGDEQEVKVTALAVKPCALELWSFGVPPALPPPS